MDDDTSEVFGLLLQRRSLMERVIDGSHDRRRLKDELDQSRSTVYRGLDQLESAGLVTERAGVYEATLYGRLVYEAFEDSIARVEEYAQAGDMLASLESIDDVPVDVLTDGELVPVRRSTRLAPTQAYHEVLRGADRIDIMSPVPFPKCVKLLHERIVEDGLETTAIVEEQVIDYLRGDWDRQLREALDGRRLDIKVTDSVLPFGLTIEHEPAPQVCLSVYDAQGSFKGLVRCESESAYEWARSVYRSFERDARPMELPTR